MISEKNTDDGNENNNDNASNILKLDYQGSNSEFRIKVLIESKFI